MVLNGFSFFHSNQPYSTKDSDSSTDCPLRHNGAWWYKACHGSNLNGLYLEGSHSSYADGVNWNSFRGFEYSLKRTEMKVK